MGRPSTRPAQVRLRGGSLKDTDFDTPGQKAAAEAILEHYDETHNLSEIARRSDWSESHVQNVFKEYFEPADGAGEDAGLGADGDITEGNLSGEALEIYRQGYRDGFDDGFDDGYEKGLENIEEGTPP